MTRAIGAKTEKEARNFLESKIDKLEQQLREREPQWFKVEADRLEAQYREQIVNLQLRNSEMATRLKDAKSALRVIMDKL